MHTSLVKKIGLRTRLLAHFLHIRCPSPLQVTEVEHEMRELLSEVAREKRNMETKFQKLLRAFQEVRLDSSD